VTRSALLGTAAMALLGGSLSAVAAPDSVAPAPRPGVEIKLPGSQEIVVYSPQRPIRLRIDVRAGDKSLGEMWRDRLRASFEFFDRDRDGFLNEKEVQNILSDTGIVQMLQNGFYQPTPQDRPNVERLDLDRDGRVSFGEYAAYYKTATTQIFREQPATPENPFNAATTESLFKLMDANGDGKLTRDEVRAMEKLVASHDSDEDECLSVFELIPNGADPRLRARQAQLIELNGRVRQPSNVNQTVSIYEPGRIPGTLTQQVIKRYDKDSDFELTREEVGFDELTFSRLDRDGNGRLDGEELDEWRTGPADVAVSLSLGRTPAECVASVVTGPQELAARGLTVKQVEKGRVLLRCGRQPIELWSAAVIGNARQPALKQQFLPLFNQAAGGKDHVLEKDLSGPNAVQFQLIRTMFDAADANGDGRMTRIEFEAFMDLQESFRSVALAISPTVQTPTLFQLLDENRDDRLGVRELRTAWDRLIALEPGDAQVVTKAAIQPSVSIRLTRGLDRFNINQVQFDARFINGNPTPQVPQKGPMWFRKMDRNADGDVSRSEYLGTKAEFNSIDADHDDLISLEEAEAHDRKMRNK
jgi:Ca2+-binding EF-hand superfamily protein